MSAKPRKCVKGYQCGFSCISVKKVCRKSLNANQAPVANTLVQTLQPKGFAERFEQHWGNAPDYINNAIAKLPKPYELTDPDNSSYHRSGGIYMHPQHVNSPREGSVWRHEYGHAIDFQINQRFSSFDRLLQTYGLSSADEYYKKFATDSDFRRRVAQDTEINTVRTPSPDRSTADLYANWLVNTTSRWYFTSLEAFRRASEDDERRLLDMRPKLTKSQLEKLPASQRNGDPDTLSARYGLYQSQKSKRTTPLPETDLRRKLFDRIQAPSEFDRATQFEPQITKTAVLKLAERAFPELSTEINDLLGSLTANKFGSGHSDEYYQKGGRPAQNKEVFANLVSLAGTGDPVVAELLEFFTPSTYQIMKKRLESL